MFGTEEGEDRDRVVADLRRRIGAIGDAGSRTTPAPLRAGAPDESDGPTAPPAPPAQAVPPAPPPPAVPGLLAVPAPLAGVLPRGGIPQGSVVSLASAAPGRAGVTGLLLSLVAAPQGIWVAAVGMPELGVLAAAELGVDLDRLALIPDPGPDVLQVLSVLADGVDVIATAPPRTLPPARQRVLTGRLRQRGVVLLVAGRWPGADLTLTVTQVRWSGIEQGHGRLRDREIDVQVGGRRAGGGATATLLLRAARDAVTVEAAPTARKGSAPPEPAYASAGAG